MPVRLSCFALFAALLALLVTSLPAFTATAQDQTASLLDLLPAAGEIGPAFVVIDSHARTLDEQATGFANASDAARVLGGWLWRENVFQVFQSTELTASGAPMATIDISLTRFADSEGAAAALPYFLGDRVAVLGQRELPSANQTAIGDETRAIDGFVAGGYDHTLYVRSGPLLLRISATAVSGSTAIAPERIAQGIIDRAAGPAVGIAQTALALPETLPLDDAASFRIVGEGDLDLPGVMKRLAGGSDTARALDAFGWQGGSYRQFASDPPAGRAGWIDISLHYFRDAAAASEAVAFFADSRQRGMHLQPADAEAVGDRAAALGGPAINGTEYTLYVSSGPLLFAITGVAPAGDPRPDVEAIAATLLAPGAPGAPVQIGEQPTPTPYPLGEMSPAPTVPTATTSPAPTPVPSAPPLPTATVVQAPTAVPTPTAIPTQPPPTEVPPQIPVAIPTAIPTAVPTATPATLPTATTGPVPTPTPRVIRPPTPAP
jgi:hypothetical protein